MTNNAVGVVGDCWRYPVKSMQGLNTDSLEVGRSGVVGDRTFGVIDASDGHLLTAKRVSLLLLALATDEAITLPGGDVVAVDDPRIDGALSAWLGRSVHLAGQDEPSQEEAAQRTYEMTFDPPDDEAEYYEIPVPPGTFLDAQPIHLVCSATLEHLARERPDLNWDMRRFRPNLVVDRTGPAFGEESWIGRDVRIGGVVIRIESPTVRCAMPLRAQPGGLEREPGLFRALNDLNPTFPNHFGLYCSVVEPGRVAIGDEVFIA